MEKTDFAAVVWCFCCCCFNACVHFPFNSAVIKVSQKYILIVEKKCQNRCIHWKQYGYTIRKWAKISSLWFSNPIRLYQIPRCNWIYIRVTLAYWVVLWGSVITFSSPPAIRLRVEPMALTLLRGCWSITRFNETFKVENDILDNSGSALNLDLR